MTTLVTGATGLLGNNVVRALLARGRAVRALVRGGGRPRALAELDVEIVPGDVTDPDSVRRACQGVACLIHSAARVHIGWSGLAESRIVNVEGTRNVAAAALAAGCRLVHVSTSDTIGLGSLEDPADEETPFLGPVPCPYVITKREAEAVVQEYIGQGLDAVIVNPGYMLGPWDWKPSSGRMLLQLARRWAMVAPSGGNSYCDVRDVADGVIAAAERGARGRRYLLAGHSLSYFDAWRLFARITGGRPPLFTPPSSLTMRMAGKVGDLYSWLSGREGDVNSAAVAMAFLPKYYTSARAERELGYRRRSVEEAAQAAWNWFCEFGYVAPSSRSRRVA